MAISAHARHALKTALLFAAANEVIGILDFVHDKILESQAPEPVSASSEETPEPAAEPPAPGDPVAEAAEDSPSTDPAAEPAVAPVEPDPADAPLES